MLERISMVIICVLVSVAEVREHMKTTKKNEKGQPGFANARKG